MNLSPGSELERDGTHAAVMNGMGAAISGPCGEGADMGENDEYPQKPKGNFHLIGMVILAAIVVFIGTDIWGNPPGEGSAAVPTQTDTVR
jgi:hypothetical protein